MKLSLDIGEPLADVFQFRRLIGKLDFIVHTRPYLAFVV